MWCLPIRVERLSTGGDPTRVLAVDPAGVIQVGDSWIPTLIRFEEPRRQGRVEIRAHEVEIDEHLAPAFLTVNALSGPPAR
jgi:hypothetical protein